MLNADVRAIPKNWNPCGTKQNVILKYLENLGECRLQEKILAKEAHLVTITVRESKRFWKADNSCTVRGE